MLRTFCRQIRCDAEPPQLAEDACLADAGFAGDLADEFAEHLPLAGASRFGRLVATSLFPDPAVERTGGDDADQPIDVLADRFAQLEQPGALFRLRVNFAGDTSAEVRQFFLQVLDVFGQSVFGVSG